VRHTENARRRVRCPRGRMGLIVGGGVNWLSEKKKTAIWGHFKRLQTNDCPKALQKKNQL